MTDAFPPEERGRALGTWAGVSALALAIGPVVGGFLTEQVSWRWIFFLNLPVAAAAIAMTLFSTRESRDETVGAFVDSFGTARRISGLVALLGAAAAWWLIESRSQIGNDRRRLGRYRPGA